MGRGEGKQGSVESNERAREPCLSDLSYERLSFEIRTRGPIWHGGFLKWSQTISPPGHRYLKKGQWLLVAPGKAQASRKLLPSDSRTENLIIVDPLSPMLRITIYASLTHAFIVRRIWGKILLYVNICASDASLHNEGQCVFYDVKNLNCSNLSNITCFNFPFSIKHVTTYRMKLT